MCTQLALLRRGERPVAELHLERRQPVVRLAAPIAGVGLSLGNQVRISNTPTWSHQVYATPGQDVQWLLNTSNIGGVALTAVVTRDVLPPHLELDSGSVALTNARGTEQLGNLPLFGGGYDAGTYNPKDNRLITLRTKVLSDFAGCRLIVRNVGHAKSAQTLDDYVDDADVIITKPHCK